MCGFGERVRNEYGKSVIIRPKCDELWRQYQLGTLKEKEKENTDGKKR